MGLTGIDVFQLDSLGLMCFNGIDWIHWDWYVSMGLTVIGVFQLD